MDVVMLSRLQFAVATMFHFLFVPLTLGLSILVAWMETKWVRTGDEQYKRMAKFWGKLFLLNFALGVVTGITLEFQFGTNWARYSRHVGDIFGSILAIEATVAFFLESSFLAVWIFGWERLSPKLHCISIWLVAAAGNVSAFWIIVANAFMQHPVGYVMRNGRLELENFWAVITQPFALVEYAHVLGAAYVLSGFFVAGISAYHLLKRNQVDFFKRSMRMAITFSLVFALFAAGTGHMSGAEVAQTQPAKLAALESHWETQTYAPLYMLLVPNPFGEGNLIQALPIPGGLSFIAYNDPSAEVVGLNDIPAADRPPVAITFASFRLMVGLGTIFVLLTLWGFFIRNRVEQKPLFLKIMLWSIPLPYIAIELGWVLTEVGRQPWIVYNIMRTSDAVSPIDASQVAISLPAFVIVYGLLGIAGYYLIAKFAGQGPETVPANQD